MSEPQQRDDLILRLAKRLNENSPEETAADLHSSPVFQGDLAWLETMFNVADGVPLRPVPPEVHEKLLALFASGQETPFDLGLAEVGVLIHDTRESGALAGVRGQQHASGDAWTLVFSSPRVDLVVDGTPLANGRTFLEGQILERDGTGSLCHIVGGDITTPIASDPSGRFEIGDVGVGDHIFHCSCESFSIKFTVKVSP